MLTDRQSRLRYVDFPLDAHILQCICLAVPIIKKQLFSALYSSLGKDSNAMVSINHDNFRVTVGVYRMVGKSYFISFTGGVYYKVII